MRNVLKCLVISTTVFMFAMALLIPANVDSPAAATTPETDTNWRYTTIGWVDVPQWTAPSKKPSTTPFENISPWTWAALQLLLGVTLLLCFESASRTRPAPSELDSPSEFSDTNAYLGGDVTRSA